MNDLILFRLYIAATFVLLLTLFTSILLYRTSIPFSRNMIRDLLPMNLGTPRSRQILHMLGLDIENYLAIYTFISFLFQLTSMTLIAIIELNDVPSLFFPDMDSFLPPEVLFTFFVLSIISGIVDLILIFTLILVFLYDMPRVSRTPLAAEIISWENQSRDFGSIHLTRFENSEKTIILADCRNDPSGKIFKFALCQEKEEGARTDCYQYDEEGQTVDKIIPTPITVNQLEELFSVGFD